MKLLHLPQKYYGIALFGAALLIGLFTLDDYGLGWDEPAQHEIGTYCFNYVFKNDPAFLSYHARDYGVLFELPLIIIEKVLRLEDTRYIYLLRHFLTHLFFLVGVLYCFRLIDRLYNNKVLALLGALLLLICPRIYADSFVNTKDIPFLGMFFICFYYAAKAFEAKTIKRFVFLGVLIGLAINLRMPAILWLVMIILMLVLDCFFEKELKKNLRLMLAVCAVAFLTLLITWPYLWHDPVENLRLAFSRMSKFNWHGSNLYAGKLALADQLDWDYIPTWFVVTTPLFYQMVGLTGLIIIVIRFFRNPGALLQNSSARNTLLYAAAFVTPVIAVIVLRSVLYDGWRHLYFIYAPFVMLCIVAIDAAFKTRLKIAALLITLLCTSTTAVFMIKNHPFENVYFNELVDKKTPEHLRMSYDLDYWGVSYRQTLEYILRHDSSSTILISADNDPGGHNSRLLPKKERDRLKYMPDTAGATYFITNYRWHQTDFASLENKIWHRIKVDNNTINAIYKLR